MYRYNFDTCLIDIENLFEVTQNLLLDQYVKFVPLNKKSPEFIPSY
jgi:hypothetical protein